MIPVNEGNEDCFKCDEFDMCIGCYATVQNNPYKAPKCRRDVIITSDAYEEYMKLKKKNESKKKRRFRLW